jgi:hypothetical protein
MATWTTALEARVKVDEELEGPLMTALAAAFAEPKPGLALGSGRLVVRLEVEADLESEAARLAAERFARAWEKATQDLLPRLERLESRRRRHPPLRGVRSHQRRLPSGPARDGRSLPRRHDAGPE